MEITEIKQRLTLAEVIKHYGYKADKQNRIHCPFHADKTPSMQLYWKTQTAYCFSSNCKTHGKSLDVIDFILYEENCTKAQAIAKAKAMISGQAPSASQAPAGREAILQQMFTYFKNAVHNSKPARDYLAQRCLDYTRLEIGYNTGQFHHGERKEQALIAACVEVGLLHPFGNNTRAGSQAYKPFAKYCLVFALRNRAGGISGLYFRSTLNEDTARHYYLKESSGLYPHYPDPATERLILTEAIIDCATLLQIPEIANHYGLLSAYGTNRLTQEHQQAIQALPQLQEIIFAFDADEAGNKAVSKYSQELAALLPNLILSRLELPDDEDVNSLMQSHQPEVSPTYSKAGSRSWSNQPLPHHPQRFPPPSKPTAGADRRKKTACK
jgi:DNA primase